MKMVYKIIAIAGLILATSSTGLSAATSGTVSLKGSLSKHSDITITPSGSELALDLGAVGGVADVLVATVVEVSNSNSGYTVVLSSSNAKAAVDKTKAILKGQTVGETHEYTIKYGGVGVTLVNGESTVTNASTKTTGVTKNVTISFNTGMNLAADTYVDTLTITIADK